MVGFRPYILSQRKFMMNNPFKKLLISINDKIGYGQRPGKYCWILSDFNNSNNASCVPHEMLHNYGCEHTPADQLNIMYPIAGTNTVIRQPQWIKVR